MNIEELSKKLQAIEKRATEIQSKAENENRELSGEELDNLEKAMSEYDELKRSIDLQKKAGEKFKREQMIFDTNTQKEKTEQQIEWRNAFNKYMRLGVNKLSNEERNILSLFESHNGVGVAIDPTGEVRTMINDGDLEKRATNSVITNPAYSYPTTLAEKFQYTLKSVGNWLDAITIINDPAGNDLVLPYYNDAGNDGAKEAEGTDAIASSTDLDAAKVTLKNYWISSTGIKVEWSTLRDSAYPIERLVLDPLMQRLSRKIAYYGTLGSGSSEPKGIAVAAAVGEIASKATIPTFTDLMNLVKLVDGAYDQGPKSGFMFHRTTALGIATSVKSTTYNQDPLWQPSFAAGLPPTLLGYKYWFNNNMNLVTTAPGTSVLFGDFSHFIMRMAGPLIVTRLEERYAELGQVGFLMSQYMDSNVDMVGTTYAPFKKIKNIMT
jgi:HK97 family phage major capsid protein